MQTYFLGANSKDGFSSLYRDFPPRPDAFLHIVKGGPGTGKSSMLRAISAAGEQRGLEVHQVLCSGDPDSLDGVYLPALGLAWVDGTAPHAIEPALFGVSGDYVNLTEYFARPFDAAEKARLSELQAAYQGQYREAYGLLAACVALGGGQTEDCDNAELRAALTALPQRDARGRVTRRFLSAISCKGLIRLDRELAGYTVSPAAPDALEEAALEVRRRGWDVILCPSPLDPATPEALLLPEQGLAFTTVPAPNPASVPLLEQAIGRLRAAKALHDELEAVYKPHMDFSALTAYTAHTIENLFL